MQTKRVVIFHPSPNLVEPIDAILALRAPDLEYVNVVESELLGRAIREGITEEIKDAIREIISREMNNSFILCTCSTLGGVSEEIGADLGAQVVRIDRPMAEVAVDTGVAIGVAAALESTLGPTRELLKSVAAQKGKNIRVVEILCADAWKVKESGDDAGYVNAVAECLKSRVSGVDVVVLAQGSMAPAKELIGDSFGIPILTSPELAIDAVMEHTMRRNA